MRVLRKNVWPATVRITSDNHKPLAKWCEDNCGYRFQGWYSYKAYAHPVDTVIYAFKDEQTAMVFKLRWVGE